MGTAFSRPNPQEQESKEAESRHDAHQRDDSLGASNEPKNGEQAPDAVSQPGPLGSSRHAAIEPRQDKEAGPSNVPLDHDLPVSPQSAGNKRKKKSKVKNKTKRLRSATQEQLSDQDERSASKVARTTGFDVKSEGSTLRTSQSEKAPAIGPQAPKATLPTTTRRPPQASTAARKDREEGELTDEDPINDAAKLTHPQTLPTGPRVTLGRPVRGARKFKEYIDRDALITGKPVSGPHMSFPPPSNSRPFALETSSRSRPKDTQSGLNYEDDYAMPAPPVASSSRTYPSAGPRSDPSRRNGPVVGIHNSQFQEHGRRSHYSSPSVPVAVPQSFAIAPAYYAQYHSHQFGNALSLRDGPSVATSPDKDMNRQEVQAPHWGEDVDMEDRDTAAERAVEENDAIGLEQAREWAAEQSLRMNQTLDRAGLRELVRLLLELSAWGVPSADFATRGVREDLLQAVYEVASRSDHHVRLVSPPPPPPVDSLPTPPPSPPPPPLHHVSRRDSIASSIEMEIATPSPQSQPIAIDSSLQSDPANLLVTSNEFSRRPPGPSGPETSSTSATGQMPQNGLATEQASLARESSSTPGFEAMSETRSASDVTLMRAKLLAHKLRKQKEIRERLRKLQAATEPTKTAPEPKEVIDLPVEAPSLSTTPPADAGSPVPPSVVMAKPASTSPLQSLEVALPKTPELDNQALVVTDSSQFFPVRAKTFNRGRKALAPAHPKSFIIDLDSDSDDEDTMTSERTRAVAAALEAEKRHTESLRKEIEKKEAARAALEARIRAMEARRQAKKAQVLSPSTRQTATMIQQTITVTSVVPEGTALSHGEQMTRESSSETAIIQDQMSQGSNLLQVTQLYDTATHDTAQNSIDGSAAGTTETTQDGIIDLSADVVTQAPGGIRPEVDEDVDMIAVQSSPVEISSPLFLDGPAVETPDSDQKPEQCISHGHAIERVDQTAIRSARDRFDPVILSEKDKAPRFTPYTSLLNMIPVAMAKTVKMKTRRRIASSPPSFLDAGGQLDRSILDSIIWTRIARTKPEATICLYEGEGGICSDTSCDNVHFSRDIIPTREAASIIGGGAAQSRRLRADLRDDWFIRLTYEDLLQLINIVIPASSPAQSALQATAADVFDRTYAPTKNIAPKKKKKAVKEKKTKAGNKSIDTVGENAVASSSSAPTSNSAAKLVDIQGSAQAKVQAVEDFLRDVQLAIPIAKDAV